MEITKEIAQEFGAGCKNQIQLTAATLRIKELEEQSVALIAKIDRMQTFIKIAARKWEGSAEVEPTFWNLLRVANETQADHLRQVRAEAGRDGFIAGYHKMHIEFVGSLAPKESVEFAADKYHASILAGKE